MDSAVDRGDALLDDVSLAVQGQGEQARLLHIGSLLLLLSPKRDPQRRLRKEPSLSFPNSFPVMKPL
jgi:hypothetical protein